MEKEIWEDVVGYEGYYQVSNLGRIKSLIFGDKILKLQKNNKGYLAVNLLGKTFKVHKIVSLSFGIEKDGCIIDHIDGNKLNNKLINLQAISQSENIIKSKYNESGYPNVSYHNQANKWKTQITIKGKRIHLGCFDYPEDAFQFNQLALKYNNEYDGDNKKFVNFLRNLPK